MFRFLALRQRPAKKYHFQRLPQLQLTRLKFKSFHSSDKPTDKDDGAADVVAPAEKQSFVKFKVTKNDEGPSLYDSYKNINDAPDGNAQGIFPMKTKFSQRKTNPTEEARLLPLITHELYNYQFYGR